MKLLDITSWLNRKPSFRLLPVNHLEKNNISINNGYEWRATGNDPAFKLQSKQRLPLGWYMLTVKIKADCARPYAKLYVNYGNGIEEDQAILMPLTRGKTFKRICYFPQLPKSMRFDPAEQACCFTIDTFSMSKLSSSYAKQLMLKKLNARHPSKLTSHNTLADILAAYNLLFTPDHTVMPYEQWQQLYEGNYFSEANIALLTQKIVRKPLISVLVATYNTSVAYLQACIESVLQQSYPHWELCIADDASSDDAVRTLIQSYADKDCRIKTAFRRRNGHISAASNTALTLAKGEYIALLDHDDLLAPHALLLMAEAINNHPDAKIIYSDEDKIDEHGNRYEPHFKCAWNRDLLYSQNYISHLGVYNTQLIEQIGGFRSGVEGSQDYDLLLRAVAQVQDHQIIHVPHVLYHWRAIEGSTALEASEKSYTTEAGIKALQNYFAETAQVVTVEQGLTINTYRIRWPIPQIQPLVSLLIPTRDGYDILKQCVDSILHKTTYQNYEIIIIDNQSSCEKTINYLRSFETHDKVRVLAYDQPFNYSAINNYGVTQAKGSIIGLINNDIEVISAEWLTEMVSHVLRQDVGCVGAKLYYTDNTLQHAGVILGIGSVAGHSHKYASNQNTGYFSRLKLTQNYSAVTAAALLVRKAVFEEVGGLNEQDLTVAFNDVDFCLKVREAGYRNLWTPYAELYHHESVSRGYDDTPEKQARFNQEILFMHTKWGKQLSRDPFYSPNLTLEREDFSIRL